MSWETDNPINRQRGNRSAGSRLASGRHRHMTSPWGGGFGGGAPGSPPVSAHQHTMNQSGQHGRGPTGIHMHTTGVANSHFHRMDTGQHTSHNPNVHDHNINWNAQGGGVSGHQHGLASPTGGPGGSHSHGQIGPNVPRSGRGGRGGGRDPKYPNWHEAERQGYGPQVIGGRNGDIRRKADNNPPMADWCSGAGIILDIGGGYEQCVW